MIVLVKQCPKAAYSGPVQQQREPKPAHAQWTLSPARLRDYAMQRSGALRGASGGCIKVSESVRL